MLCLGASEHFLLRNISLLRQAHSHSSSSLTLRMGLRTIIAVILLLRKRQKWRELNRFLHIRRVRTILINFLLHRAPSPPVQRIWNRAWRSIQPHPQFPPQSVLCDGTQWDVHRDTGLTELEFLALFKAVYPYLLVSRNGSPFPPTKKTTLTPWARLYLVLKWLRCGSPMESLSSTFQTSPSTISRYFL